MIPHFDLSPEERASAAWDAYLCQNVMSHMTIAWETGMTDADFDALWSERQDLSWGENDGFYIGRDSVRSYLLEDREACAAASQKLICTADPTVPFGPEGLRAGSMDRVNLMSPLIEVARDGKTAKGMWYCPGVSTAVEADAKMHLQWHYSRFAADFVLEGDCWKLWHVFMGSEFRFEMGHAYIPATGMKPLPDATVYAQNPATVGMPCAEDYRRPYDLKKKLYSIDYGWSPYPVTPIPYESFETTFSYGPEPFMSLMGKECAE